MPTTETKLPPLESDWPDFEPGDLVSVTQGNRKFEVGVVVRQTESGFGHKHAIVHYDDGFEQPVRTKLLKKETIRDAVHQRST